MRRNDKQIRASEEIQEIINFIRSKSIIHHGRDISTADITRKIAKYIDKEKLWQNEFAKK